MELGSDSGLNLQHRIFVPPGTFYFSTAFSTYGASGDGQKDTRAAYRFALPPVSTLEQINEANTPPNINWSYFDTLKLLVTGLEGRFYSRAGSGGLMISTSDPLNHPYRIPNSKGGWIYSNILASPWNKILNLQYIIQVEKSCYDKWYNQAKWDYSGNPIEGQFHSCE